MPTLSLFFPAAQHTKYKQTLTHAAPPAPSGWKLLILAYSLTPASAAALVHAQARLSAATLPLSLTPSPSFSSGLLPRVCAL